MEWFDIGVNLGNERFDVDAVLTRATDAGVSGMLVTGTSVAESQRALALCQRYPQQLYCTAGIHPHYAVDAGQDYLSQLRELASQPEVRAIGECGLDFNRNFSPKAQQLAVFEQQLQLAVETAKPVFLHEREAFDEQIRLLKRYRPQLVGGVAHCFTGNTQQMLAYLELDLYVGITGWVCDTSRGEDLRAAIKHLPLARLLLETDAPYLRPKGLANNRKVDKGQNEPAYLPYIATQVAMLLDVDITEVQQHSLANSQQLFALNPTVRNE